MHADDRPSSLGWSTLTPFLLGIAPPAIRLPRSDSPAKGPIIPTKMALAGRRLPLLAILDIGGYRGSKNRNLVAGRPCYRWQVTPALESLAQHSPRVMISPIK